MADSIENHLPGTASKSQFSQENELYRNFLKPEQTWKLPFTFTSFIGREQEVAKICILLQRPEVRLLTILGTGGIGKTRLGIQVSTVLQEHFVDGVYFIPLASIHEPDLVASTIAQGLGVQEVGEQRLFEQIKVALRTRQLLLLLDNFEHVVTAAPLLTELLAACPRVKIVVTSRSVLHIQGEYEYPTPPLPVPDLKHLPEMDVLAQNASIMLFVQRAQAVRPEFQLTKANANTIAQICTRLDGLPLAIELAASRVKMFPLQALLAKLERRFEVLTNGVRDAPMRQQTLHNTITWSYDLLDKQEQQLFSYLSAFTGGCTLEAIEDVVMGVTKTADNTFPLLEKISSLLDKSLVLQLEQDGEVSRFSMLETIREYGQERLLESGKAELARKAHATHFLNLVEQAGPLLKGTRQLAWMAQIEQEHENVRAALGWLTHSKETELAMRFCATLGWFWHLRGYWSEGRRWIATTLELPGAEKPTEARAKMLYNAGDLAYYQDDYHTAHTMLIESAKLCREQRLERELANTLNTLGMLMHMQGNSRAAHPLLEESEKLCRTRGYNWELSHLLRKLSHIAWSQGDLTRATAYAQEGLSLARKLGDTSLIATTLSALSGIANRQGNLTLATALTQETLALAQKLGDKSLIATATQNLGYLAAQEGMLSQASAYAQEALSLFRQLGDKTFITAALHSLGYLALLQGNTAQAAKSYQEGLSLSEEIGNDMQMSWHLIGFAEVAEKEGHSLKSCRLLSVAETKFDVTIHMNTTERAAYDDLVQRVRTQLGENVFATQWAQGRMMTPQEALKTSEQTPLQSAPLAKPSSESNPAGLTAREMEILRLVAQGLTDAQVAEKLIISTRTVSWHLTSIYSKLAVSSRSAATRYALEHHLT